MVRTRLRNMALLLLLFPLFVITQTVLYIIVSYISTKFIGPESIRSASDATPTTNGRASGNVPNKCIPFPCVFLRGNCRNHLTFIWTQ